MGMNCAKFPMLQSRTDCKRAYSTGKGKEVHDATKGAILPRSMNFHFEKNWKFKVSSE